MRVFAALRLLALAALVAAAGASHAHSASTAYLQLGAAGEIPGTAASTTTAASTGAATPWSWRVALRDLDARLDLDTNDDGQLTWGEVEDRALEIHALAAASVVLSDTRGAACALSFAPLGFERRDDTGFALIAGRAHCATGTPAQLAYRFLERLDASHRVLVTTAAAAMPRSLAPGADLALSVPADEEIATGFAAMFADGVTHILGGPDHLLFLVALLLPAVLVLQPGRPGPLGARWRAREALGPALVQVAWLATAFTLAHSITLGLASFHVVRVPASIIEPLIAVTVLAAALNNLKPVVTTRLAACAFAFGLIHGFGFAEVLAPLSLPTAELAVALLAFNLGVEGGQLVIVAIAFALLAAARRWRGYPRWVLGAGSAALALIACGWIVERVFDVPVFELVAWAG